MRLMNKFLQRAFEIAAQIDPHQVTPNPRVGCVVVRDGEVIAEGVHECHGGPHAEVNALEKVAKLPSCQVTECEVYVTLEPCDCFAGKKTGSCVDLLIEKKPKKVVVGSLDPKFGGRSVEKMKKAGIEVEVSDEEYGVRNKELNPFFGHYQKQKKPWITLKVGQSLNGKITGGNPYITNEASLQKVHEMRAQYAAILTTTETILQDDPRLDCRLAEGSNPDIIILGKRAISPTAKIWQIGDRDIFQLESLDDFLESDQYTQLDSVMTECGSEMNALLMERGLVNEIQLFVAPKILRDDEKQNFEKELDLEGFQLEKVEKLRGDLGFTYREK